jgi:protein tyrosine phosphatase (PTP) superfamily phosphohydrolase (DUF442 family)
MRPLYLYLLLPVLLSGCSTGPSDAGAEPGPHAGLPQFVQWSPGIAQGGQPDPETGFASLAELGFTTVVSVDGALPAVAAAEAHGLRYVHVPVGYDGVPAPAALAIIKAVESSPGPVYLHCHHGRHRGPAAAALARIARGEATHAQAVIDLAASGCSPDYAGLYRDVRAFAPPTREALAALDAADLPSAVGPAGRLETMVFLDQRFDAIRAARGVAWAAPHPDIDPAHEVGMVENALRDLLEREEREGAEAAFLDLLRASHASAVELEKRLRAGASADADAVYERFAASCDRCHQTYRN